MKINKPFPEPLASTQMAGPVRCPWMEFEQCWLHPLMVPREWAEGCPHRGSDMTSGASVGVFLGEVGTGMGGLNKERGWASFLGGPDRARRPKRVNYRLLSRDIRLLPSDIRAPRSPAFGRRLGLMPLAPPVLRPLDPTEFSTGFPGSPASRQQTVGFLGLWSRGSR